MNDLNTTDLLFYTCTNETDSEVQMIIVHLPTSKEVRGTGNSVSELSEFLLKKLTEDVNNELNPKDLIIDTFTYGVHSQVDMRILHKPTNLHVEGSGNITSKLKRELIKELTELVNDDQKDKNDFIWNPNYVETENYKEKVLRNVMNKIETAQYLTKEILNNDKIVVHAGKGENDIEAVITYSDGTKRTVTGKFAIDILNAPKT